MMNPFDPKLHERLRRLEDLEEIEARLAKQERKTGAPLIVTMTLAVLALALWLGHLLDPSWLPLGH
jgi:hypothetical protein